MGRRTFDEKIAVACGLIPFTFFDEDEHNLLALTDKYKKNFSPRLDAYQTLTHKTIDRKSLFFSYQKRFESVVGKEVVSKMNKIIYKG